MQNVNSLMIEALDHGVFPGAVLMVGKNESIVFNQAFGYSDLFSKQRMTLDTIFDLASLTKPLATTLAIAKLVEQSKIDLDQNLASLLTQFEKTPKGKIKIKHLLTHTSGLPAYRPYYKFLRKLSAKKRQKVLQNFLVKEPLISNIGQRVIYSDLGFMILSWVIEKVAKLRIDDFLNQEIYHPLGLKNLFFIDLKKIGSNGDFAATELCYWRNILLKGKVHDDNAFILGGVEGHAGLFGTADEVMRLLSTLLLAFKGRSHKLLNQKTVSLFFTPYKDTGRTMGFDKPSTRNSSTGKFFSNKSIGHLGYTGSSFWMDTQNGIIVILLTNRVHPSRYNNKIVSFRPKLHDKIMKNIAICA